MDLQTDMLYLEELLKKLRKEELGASFIKLPSGLELQLTKLPAEVVEPERTDEEEPRIGLRALKPYGI